MQDSIINPATARDVDVCVCTFRRASVSDLLASLAKLETPGWRVRVIVADNDDQPSARETVESAFAAFRLDGRYIHAPARNISVARNACLDAAQAPLVAFIDDDPDVIDVALAAGFPAQLAEWVPRNAQSSATMREIQERLGRT